MNDSEKLLPESVLLQTGFVPEHASELVICKKCLGFVGFANVQNKNDVTEHFQICDCLFKGTDRKKKLIPAVEYFDFGIAFEFCYCCGLKLLNSGLNTSSFFCEECLEYVQMYNDQHILDPSAQQEFFHDIYERFSSSRRRTGIKISSKQDEYIH